MLLGARVAGGSSATAGARMRANHEDGVPEDRKTAHRVCKRSYKRTLKRAEQYGTAVYKGRRIGTGVPTLPLPNTKPIAKTTWPRMEIASWNCSGLSQELFLEIQVWLKTQPSILIFALQETHWSMTSEWSTEDWYVIHSAAPRPKQAGVMIGIRRNAFEPNSSSWADVEPGRSFTGEVVYANSRLISLTCISRRCHTTVKSKSKR